MSKGQRNIRKRVQQRVEAGLCLCCNNNAFSRGLCQTCHRYAMTQIRSGAVTEKQMIDGFLLLPSKRNGRKRIAPIANAIEKLKANRTSPCATTH